MTNARRRTIIGILYFVLGTEALVSSIVWAVLVALPHRNLITPDAAYVSCLGLGILATGYRSWRVSAHLWPQILAVLALVASAAVALGQVVSHWDQPLNMGNVTYVFMSLVFLLLLWALPHFVADDSQNRSGQQS